MDPFTLILYSNEQLEIIKRLSTEKQLDFLSLCDRKYNPEDIKAKYGAPILPFKKSITSISG